MHIYAERYIHPYMYMIPLQSAVNPLRVQPRIQRDQARQRLLRAFARLIRGVRACRELGASPEAPPQGSCWANLPQGSQVPKYRVYMASLFPIRNRIYGLGQMLHIWVLGPLGLHSRRLTWNLTGGRLKRTIIFQGPLFRLQVCFSSNEVTLQSNRCWEKEKLALNSGCGIITLLVHGFWIESLPISDMAYYP